MHWPIYHVYITLLFKSITDDCFWDFVACKRENSVDSVSLFRKGRMINRQNSHARDQSCCQNRYHQCCEHVNNPQLNEPIPTPTTTPKPTTTIPVIPRSVCPKSVPSNLSKSSQDVNKDTYIYIYIFRLTFVCRVYNNS